jgi:hypothetical protein
VTRTLALAPILVALLASGCASGGSSTGGESSSDRNRISREELVALPPSHAYRAVQLLRPNWLRSRSGTLRNSSGRTPPVVFLDGRPFGELATLYDFGVQDIQEIRFIPAPDATIRYGTGYPGGIINVITRGRA